MCSQFQNLKGVPPAVFVNQAELPGRLEAESPVIHGLAQDHGPSISGQATRFEPFANKSLSDTTPAMDCRDRNRGQPGTGTAVIHGHRTKRHISGYRAFDLGNERRDEATVIAQAFNQTCLDVGGKALLEPGMRWRLRQNGARREQRPCYLR